MVKINVIFLGVLSNPPVTDTNKVIVACVNAGTTAASPATIVTLKAKVFKADDAVITSDVNELFLNAKNWADWSDVKADTVAEEEKEKVEAAAPATSSKKKRRKKKKKGKK